MQEGLATEHGCELLTHTLEHFLDCCRVSDECRRHFQVLWWNVTNGCLDIVWNPFHKVTAVLILHIQHLLINLLGGQSSPEHGRCGEVTSMSWIGSAHHVLGIPHLLSKFWYSQRAVHLASTGCQWRESNHEEVQSWEWNQIDSQLSQISIQLSWETKGRCDSRHDHRDEVVEISKAWVGELHAPEANVIQGFIIQNETLICILHELMNRQCCIVWLHNSIRHLWRWHNRVCAQHSLWVLLSDLTDQQCSHS
mmetsp:Transcript_5934/g.11583  ORF Transcript_5934/g.11583 Transcript_5934/m.11583 type:complete len:252 (+) Transcript_5934:210-965(+)